MIEIAKPATSHLSLFEKQELEFMGEFLTMDFDDVDYAFQNIETSRTVAEVTPRSSATVSPVKANNDKQGSKIKRDDSGSITTKSKRVRRAVSPVPMLEPAKFPNMSRKPRSNILYVFPTFDKCDSLIFFPNTMSKYLNSGDFPSLLKLFTTHLDKNCEIAFCGGIRPGIKQMVKLFEFMDHLHPDMMMCVHHTKVIENEIHATAYSKFTDSKTIKASLRGTTTDPTETMFLGDSDECFREKINMDDKTEKERNELNAVMEQGGDTIVYMKIAITLTFDECSKKGMRLAMDAEITSLQAVQGVL